MTGPLRCSRRVIRGVVLGLIGCSLVGCGGPRQPTIKIGFVGPLTGDQAAEGIEMLHAAELAVAQAQAAPPVAGYRVELVPLDDQHSPSQAVATAKRFAADPEVLVVVGHLNSSCTKPAAAIYHQARITHINPVSSNPDISRQGFDTFFRICATDDVQGLAGARFAHDVLKTRRVFVIDDLTTYGRGLANEFMQASSKLGMAILGHEGITQGEKDFTPLLTKIKALNPDLIFFAGMFPEGAILIKQRQELQIPAKFLGGDGLYEPTLITLATPPAAEGAYLTALGGDIRLVPTARAFVEAYSQRYGPPGSYAAYAYEATRLALTVIHQAGRADRAAVLQAMQQLKEYPGILGTHHFDAHGDTQLKTIGIFIVHDGKFQFVDSVT